MKTLQKPYTELSTTLGVSEIWFKREDLHPYGSHKGRSIPLMIKEYAKLGIKQFVISSSGNAALAALIAVQKHNQNNPANNIELTIYIGKNIETTKLKRLQKELTDQKIILQQVENPKQTAFQQEKEGMVKNLRQSTDDLALKGYFELAEDLSKIPNLQAVFIPTSSGTTAQALAEAFQKINLTVQIHIVQTTNCHPIAEIFDTENTQSSEKSLAGAIVDIIAHRKEKVVEAVRNTQGSGWIIENTEIETAINLATQNCDFTLSTNSALSLAGLIKATQQGWNWSGPVCCLVTGQ